MLDEYIFLSLCQALAITSQDRDSLTEGWFRFLFSFNASLLKVIIQGTVFPRSLSFSNARESHSLKGPLIAVNLRTSQLSSPALGKKNILLDLDSRDGY